MFGFTVPSRIYLYSKPTDMRKSFDGLAGLVINQLAKDPIRDGMFVFVNRRRDRLKLLLWDRHGFWLLYKRLEQGRFQLPTTDLRDTAASIDISELSLMIEGIDLASVRRRKRYRLGGKA